MQVAVVGAGTMGSGIAQVAALAGHIVVVIDPAAPALERGRSTIQSSLETLIARGKLSEADAHGALDRLTWSTDLSDARAASLAIEAVVERLDVKIALFQRLSAVMGDDAILATNTSSLSVTAIGDGLPNPARFLGLHFFNPVPVMKLVEVVGGAATDPAVVKAMAALMRGWGKRAVVARDVPGFIVNRVARPFYAEAFLALDDGIAADVIDLAMTTAGGFKMGPLALADMIGHDINYAAAATVYEGMRPHIRFRPQERQEALVKEGYLGRKSGRGVYTYPQAPVAAPVPATSGPIAVGRAPNCEAFAWLEGHVDWVDDDLPARCISVGTTVIAQGDGRPLSQRHDVQALIDYALDQGTAHCLIATGTDDAASSALAALAAAVGKILVLVADRPGQLVLRTLAQLANGAADADAADVATPAAIDEAMLYGANYPVGPLRWAHDYGTLAVRAVLSNIAHATQDDIYLPSDGLRASRESGLITDIGN